MRKRTKIIAFTYEMTPEDKGFSVRCLDWDCVFTEGDNVEECKKNAAEVTRMYLKELAAGTLDKRDYPQLKAHKTNIYQFILWYDTETSKVIDPSVKYTIFSKAVPVRPTELVMAG